MKEEVIKMAEEKKALSTTFMVVVMGIIFLFSLFQYFQITYIQERVAGSSGSGIVNVPVRASQNVPAGVQQGQPKMVGGC